MRKAEDKLQARALVVNRGMSVSAAARELGIPRRTVADWATAEGWLEMRNTLDADIYETGVKKAELDLEDAEPSIENTARNVLRGIDIWLNMHGVVMPKEASALASALVSLNSLAPNAAEKALGGVIILPEAEIQNKDTKNA